MLIKNQKVKGDLDMLLQFSVENFRSFKNEAVLSMEASSDQDLPEHLSVTGKTRCLNTAVLFGASGAGKSNLFSALTSAILLIRNSNRRQINEPLREIVPFCFDSESASKPASFEFVFIAQEKLYVYGFSAARHQIESEYLYVYHSSKPSTIFERSAGDVYQFTSPILKRELLPLTLRTAPNKLFLAADAKQLFFQHAPLFENDEDQSLHAFTLQLLQEADLPVADFELKSENLNLPLHPGLHPLHSRLPRTLFVPASTFPASENHRVTIETIHAITDTNGSGKYQLPLQEESQAVRMLLLLAPALKRAFETGETLCMDNLDAILHPALLQYLVSLFHNPSVNKAHGQLILSSHDLSLLSLHALRRDQIWFADKNPKTGISELYSLDEFSFRKNENIRKAYLLGRFGSMPNLPGE